jgi:hypothetical protein
VVIDRDDTAEPLALRQPGGQGEPEVVRRASHRDYRQVLPSSCDWRERACAWLASYIPAGALALGGIAPPLANLGNSVAHREALLG